MAVTCSTCQHFTPSETTPSHGIGTCTIDYWRHTKSVVARDGSFSAPAPWAEWLRLCDKHGSKQ